MNPLKEWTKERMLKQTSWFFKRRLAEPLTKGFKKQKIRIKIKIKIKIRRDKKEKEQEWIFIILL